MELLDDLEVGPLNSKAFRKQLDISIESQAFQSIRQENEGDHDQESPFASLHVQESSILGFGSDAIDTQTRSPGTGPPAAPRLMGLFGSASSILSRVQRRLNGEPQEADQDEQPTHDISPTQNFIEEDTITKTTQVIANDIHDSINSQSNDKTQPIDSARRDTQITSSVGQPTLADSAHSQAIAEQEHEEEEEEETQQLGETQAIDQTQTIAETLALDQTITDVSATQADAYFRNSTNLFVDDSDEEQPETERTQVDKDIEKLFESGEEADEASQKEQRRKKVEELAAKKKAERLLEEQKSRSKEAKDLETKIELHLSDYESSDDDEPTPTTHFDLGAHTNKKFGKDALFAAFGMSTTGEVELTKSSPVKEKDTPSTSPHELSPSKGDIELSDSDSDDDFDALDMLTREQTFIKKETTKPKLPVIHGMQEPKHAPVLIELDDSDSDVEVEFSKAALFDLRARISKQKALNSQPKKKNQAAMTKRQLFQELKNASRKQLQEEFGGQLEDPKEKVLLERANLNVKDLLQKHIEHNNRLREKEEADKRRQENGEEAEDQFFDEDHDDYEAVSVADSEFSEDEDEDDDAEIKRKSRRMMVKDDEEGEENADDDNDDIQPTIDAEERHVSYDHSHDNSINLGGFGGNLSQSFDKNGSQNLKEMFNGISMTQMYEKGTQRKSVASTDIFGQLRNNGNKVIGEESFTERTFNEAIVEDQSLAESFDGKPVLLDDETETQHVDIEAPESFSSADIPSSPSQENVETRKKFKRLTKKRQFDDDESEDESEEEESEEQKEERLRQIELMKQKRRELEAEQKRQQREMKAKGLDKMMENEAEESEDEWFGIGGADGEKSDVEDSEDEKMVDDFTKVKINRTELEKRLRDENVEADNKMIERLLTDLENGRLGKRGKGDNDLGLDVDDGEDEIIRALRLHQQMKMREQFEKDAALKTLAKDKKAKAFFATIADSQDFNRDIFGASNDSSSEDEEDENPFQDTKKHEFKDPSTIKKRKITEKFVQKTLSFISNGDYEDDNSRLYFRNSRRFSNEFEEAFSDDLSTLKQNSVIQMADKTPVKKSSTADLIGETSPSNPFKIPSLTSKRSFQITSVSSTNSGEVTYSNQYKASSSNKSSVMSFGKRTIEVKKQQLKEQRVLKARKTTKVIQQGNRLKKLSDSGFD